MRKPIPKRSRQRFDGGLNYFTKDCSSCEFYRDFDETKLCGNGLVFKYLVEREKGPKACVVKHNTKDLSENGRSINYLDNYLLGNIGSQELNSGKYIFPKRGKHRSSLVQLKLNFQDGGTNK